MKTLYRSRLLLPSASSAIIKDASMMVEDGIIKGVGADNGLGKEWKPEKTVDLGNSLVMPSFSNLHTHVAMVMLRGAAEGKPLDLWLNDMWAIEGRLNHDQLRAGSVVGLYDLVNSGITSFIDFYDVMPMLEALKLFKVKATIGLPFLESYKEIKDESWRRIKMVKHYEDLITSAGARMALAPHSTYSCSEELLRELAKLDEYPVETHVSETNDEVLKLKERSGLSPFKYLKKVGLLNNRLIAAHGVYITEEEIGLVRDSGAILAHCPRSNARLGSGIAPVSNLLGEGIRIGLGTDGPASGEDFDMFEEMRMAVYLSRASTGNPSALGIREVLYMATEAGHHALGVGSGKLENGYPADFISIGLDRLPVTWDLLSSIVYGGSSSIIKDVYLDGNPIKFDYRVRVSDQMALKDSIEEVKAFMNGGKGI
ncbi:MAG: amidohydrolase family protein [Nitrososphaerota archaeon]|nr:amidohydrolase family protein [Nitrososphaerota archaeon]